MSFQILFAILAYSYQLVQCGQKYRNQVNTNSGSSAEFNGYSEFVILISWQLRKQWSPAKGPTCLPVGPKNSKSKNKEGPKTEPRPPSIPVGDMSRELTKFAIYGHFPSFPPPISCRRVMKGVAGTETDSNGNFWFKFFPWYEKIWFLCNIR